VPARSGALLLGLLAWCVPAGRAELAQSGHWALTADAAATLAYDSNLFARAGGGGDGYALLTPELSLQRLNATTGFHADLSVQSFSFFTRSGLDSLDPTLALALRYPVTETEDPTQLIDMLVDRSTEVNADVGGRLRRQDLDTRWSGTFATAAKTAVEGRVELRQTDYLTAGYNNNEFALAGGTVAWRPDERLELGAAYDFEFGRSLPRDPAATTPSFAQHLLGLRGRGDFLPKVSGSFSVGLARTAFHGTAPQTDDDLEGDLSLVWQATARGSLTLAASRRPSFSPDGFAYLPTSVGPQWTQEFAGGYSATLGAEVRRTEYRSDAGNRVDRSRGAFVELHYALTDRCTAAVTAHYTRQQSPDPQINFERAIFTSSVACKF